MLIICIKQAWVWYLLTGIQPFYSTGLIYETDGKLFCEDDENTTGRCGLLRTCVINDYDRHCTVRKSIFLSTRLAQLIYTIDKF